MNHLVWRRLGCLVLVIASGLMAGCQTGNAELPQLLGLENAIEMRDARLQNLDEFQFSGGLGIWTKEESLSVRIVWQQSAENLQLNLSGPLGLGDLRLYEKNGTVTLSRGDEVILQGSSADEVVQRGLGLAVPIPMEQLKLWVRGLPGNAVSISRDAVGKLETLRYKDVSGTLWQARFKSYVVYDDLAVPALITASGGPYSVRLRLKNWQKIAKLSAPSLKGTNKRLPIPSR